MGIRLFEHRSYKVSRLIEGGTVLEDIKLHLQLTEEAYRTFSAVKSKIFNNNSNCYIIKEETDCYNIRADYCIGLDWLGDSGYHLLVEPKINVNGGDTFAQAIDLEEDKLVEATECDSDGREVVYQELDYLRMLLDVMSVAQSAKEVDGLIQIDWVATPIKIKSKDDQLTPFLVCQFLNLLKAIVRKGLKKSYYTVKENLTNKVKGKINIGLQIKQNIYKNRFTKTHCEYQVFGEDSFENRFLKKTLKFVSSYVENNKQFFSSNLIMIEDMLGYCRPAFEHLCDEVEMHRLMNIRNNPFFKEYKEAFKIGKQILKRFAYNISQTAQQEILTPPFWIDMPRLFELYVYQGLLKANNFNSSKIKYQFSTYGNALDILIKDGIYSMVIDAKYKLHYNYGQIHADMRQVAGYARLNKVLNELDNGNPGFQRECILPCLIIYPDIENGINLQMESLDCFRTENLINADRRIPAYYEIYKLGIKLPYIV
jgi:5-methylcytosine-specific restriction enzyme subunit McrC